MFSIHYTITAILCTYEPIKLLIDLVDETYFDSLVIDSPSLSNFDDTYCIDMFVKELYYAADKVH